MSDTKTLWRSFAGGEITPELYGRADLTKFQTGLARCRNFIVLPHGPITRRPGFEQIIETKDSTRHSRLIPFTLGDDETYILEVGHQYMRFHTDGATLLEASKSIVSVTQANPAVMEVTAHGWSNGNWLFLAVNGMTPLNGRFVKIANVTTDTFELRDLAGNNISTVGMPAFTSGTAARVYEIATPYDEGSIDLLTLRHAQSEDSLTVVHPSYPQRELRRLGATNWTFTTVSFDPTITAPTNLAGDPTAFNEGGTPDDPFVHEYCVSTVDESASESFRSLVVSVRNELWENGNFNSLTWSQVTGGFRYNVYKRLNGVFAYAGQVAHNGSAAVAITGITKADPAVVTAPGHTLESGDTIMPSGVGGMTQVNGNVYIVANPTATTFALLDRTSRNVDSTGYGTYTSGGTATPVGFFIDQNITPDTATTPPESNDPFSGSGNYPRAVSWFEQRRCFAGTTNEPQKLWTTKSGTDSNMAKSLPLRDDDPIEFRVRARERNTIRHIVPLRELLLLTSSAVWKVGAPGDDALTPSNVTPRPQAYIGASDTQPIVTGESALFEESGSGHMVEVKYSFDASGYTVDDISIMAPHLFDGFNLRQTAYSSAPAKIVWSVNSAGLLLGLTYVPKHEVAAWHWHDTDGLFESCAVAREGGEDRLYVIAQRTVNSRTVRYIERMASLRFAAQEDAFFIDAGDSYYGAPITTIGGLHHLEGKQVRILFDGAVHPPRTVVNGSITLEAEASVVHVGLGFVSDAQTLPLAYEAQANGQGEQKNVNEVFLRVNRSGGFAAGPTFEKLREAKWRTTEVYGTPPSLRSDVIALKIDSKWQADGHVCIHMDDPLPLTILSAAFLVATGD